MPDIALEDDWDDFKIKPLDDDLDETDENLGLKLPDLDKWLEF